MQARLQFPSRTHVDNIMKVGNVVLDRDKQHVFIVGCKGVPAKYGGYETFVEKLLEHQQDRTNLQYHVACKGYNKGEFSFHDAHCYNICVPSMGYAEAIYYDTQAVRYCIAYTKKHQIKNPILYILSCKIGPFAPGLFQRFRKLGGRIYINLDGMEWKRNRPWLMRMYWKQSDRIMAKRADLLVCDSMNIETFVQSFYRGFSPKTVYIAYGAETRPSALADDADSLIQWQNKYNIRKNAYYLVVGRFVPENNYYTIVREFMMSSTNKDLVLITSKNDKFLSYLKQKTGAEKDPRIKFVGSVYDKELLMKIRENAYAYIHGHQLGGTNPSLLEAMYSTRLNLLYKVCFNEEVGADAAIYWSKEEGNLSKIIDGADKLSENELDSYHQKSRKQIIDRYSWEFIADKYEAVFLGKLSDIGENQ